MKQWPKDQWARVPEKNQPIVGWGLLLTLFLLIGGGLVIAGEMSPSFYAFDMMLMFAVAWYSLTRPPEDIEKPEDE